MTRPTPNSRSTIPLISLALNTGEGTHSVAINAPALPVPAIALNERNEVVALDVLPPPGPECILPARDGRRQRGPSPRGWGTRPGREDRGSR